MPDCTTTITIVSDLHLAAGGNSGRGRHEPPEPFSHDLAFARWLDHLRERAAASGEHHRLLLLGDIFDFPRVRSVDAKDASTEEAAEPTIVRLNRIAAGHAPVFSALGHWLGAGMPIDIIPGNHDFELMRPSVQKHLGALLARAAGTEQMTSVLTVWSWIYHVPGVLYAEHGQQYHDLNSFPALVWLERQEADMNNLPLGAALDTFVRRVIWKLGPKVDSPNSLMRLLSNIVVTGPKGIARVLPDVVRLAAVTGRHFVASRLPGHRTRRERYRAAILVDQAAATGIRAECLDEIDQLAESIANRMLVRVVGIGVRHLGGSLELPPKDHYLVGAASEIRRILDEAGLGTAFYVFGHSHRAEQRVLGGPAGATYLNTGSWAWRGTESNPLLTFATVTWDPTVGEASAILQKWNDKLGQPELVGTPVVVPIGTATFNII
jgi:UDP-2,3-diacylglucosamine pyrophosphatase LpxH